MKCRNGRTSRQRVGLLGPQSKMCQVGCIAAGAPLCAHHHVPLPHQIQLMDAALAPNHARDHSSRAVPLHSQLVPGRNEQLWSSLGLWPSGPTLCRPPYQARTAAQCLLGEHGSTPGSCRRQGAEERRTRGGEDDPEALRRKSLNEGRGPGGPGDSGRSRNPQKWLQRRPRPPGRSWPVEGVQRGESRGSWHF
eukprot:scaffold264_cov317-Pinguiococcus_pyrenoidosus.AAC.19